MAVKVRGVQQIRTLGSVLGTGTHSNERHVHQFQLASLELERTRRTFEKQVASRRIRDIDARLAELDELTRMHLEFLGLRSGDGQSRARHVLRSCGRAAIERRRVLRY